MLKSYLKIAWRSLRRNKFYSLVNIGGLTIGLTCCILIGLYLANELSYDRFHVNANRLFRVTTEYTTNGAVSQVGQTGSMPGPRLSSAFPAIQSFVRIQNFQPYVVKYEARAFVEPRFFFADSTFFTMFTFPLIEGDARTALNAPNKLVITRSMEKKYFGNRQALGKTVVIGGTRQYLITGVAEDIPINSQLHFDFVASYASLPNANQPNWSIEVYTTYFLLRKGVDPVGLEKSIDTYMRKQPDLGNAPGDYLTFHLEPMTRVHLYSSLSGTEANGNILYIYILGAIALLILGIACVNYTNLATAQSARRMPEIGIRKVMGSRARQLFWQFIGESLLLNAIALFSAIGLAVLLLPFFDRMVERSLDARYLASLPVLGGMGVLYLFISFAAGVYPAVLLSRLHVMKVLKSGFSFSARSGMLHRSLIVFQFAISVLLIISTVIIYQQLSYIQHKDLGYDKDHLIVLPVDALTRANFKETKQAIERIPNVLGVTCGAEQPTLIHWDDELTTNLGATPMYINAAPTDIDFVRTMGLTIVAGLDFSRADWLKADSTTNPINPETTYMLNEAAVKALGWTSQQAIGKRVYRSGVPGLVKAVVRDFHFASLHETIHPLVIFLDARYAHIFQAFVRVRGKDLPATLRELESTWHIRVPHRPFEYHFLDDTYSVIYHTERQTARIFTTFSSLAILLACLGLFALAAYSTVQRAKEIGIRKVLGARVDQIVLLVSGDFLRLVILASLIAFPVAWWTMRNWLDSFAYRISIQWWVFAVAGLAALGIALLTIGLHAVRAANASLVKSLRAE